MPADGSDTEREIAKLRKRIEVLTIRLDAEKEHVRALNAEMVEVWMRRGPAPGVLTDSQFAALLKAVHPDRRAAVTLAELAEVTRLLNERRDALVMPRRRSITP